MKVYRVGDFVNVEEISTSAVIKIDVDDVTVIDWGTGSDKLGIHSNLTQITYTDEYQNIVDQAGNVLGSTKEQVRLALVALTTQTGGAVVNDTLTSTSTTEALSANQGRALKGLIDGHASATGNPHGTTKADIGLTNVDDTSDEDKNLKNWLFLLSNWDTAPSIVKELPTGNVYVHTYKGVSRYRFAGNDTNYTAQSDAFYEDFDVVNDTLTGKIVSRAG